MSKISELSDGGSLVSTDFLIAVRSGGNVKVQMDTINVDQVDLGDNEMIRLGNSQDLTLVHTSTQSIINQAGIGDLLLQKAGTTKASITANGLEFPDNSKAIFGTGNDIKIYHNAGTSFITESGSGNFKIGGENLYLQNTAHNENYLAAIANQGVTLFYNNVAKLASTASGCDVTGTVTATQAEIGSGTDGVKLTYSTGNSTGIVDTGFTSTGLEIRTGNVQRMLINSSGNVGINVADPTHKLEVVKDNTYAAKFGGDGGSSDFSIEIGQSGTSASPGFNATAGSMLFSMAGTQAMRIDTSRNLLVSDTTANPSGDNVDSGIALHNAGLVRASTNNAAAPLDLNVKGRDGDIAVFRKDGTTIGSVGVVGSNQPYLVGTTAGGFAISHLNSTNAVMVPVTATGTNSDATHDIGYSGKRFRNIELSGTANVGVGRFTAQSLAHSAATLVLGHEGSSKSQIRAYGINAGTIGSLEFMVSASDGTGSSSMTLDSSANLLVGKTSFDSTTVGAIVRPTGAAILVADGGDALLLNRKTSDGSIIDFRKDNTTVGSIGVASSNNLVIDGLVASHAGLEFGTGRITPRVAGATADNAVDLGYSTQRFQDLWLSGGAYLGGTGAANKLEDYEEGTFTPTIIGSGSNPTVTYGGRTGKYTKVGNLVTVYISMSTSAFSGGSGNLLIDGLPFTANGDGSGGAPMFYRVNSFTETSPFINGNTAYVIFLGRDNTDTSTAWSVIQTSAWTASNPTITQFSMTYFTS